MKEYAIMRLNKIHSKSSVAAIERHGRDRERLKNRSHPENKCIYISGDDYKNLTLNQALSKRLKQSDCKVTKQSVLMYEFVFAFTPSAEERIKENENEWIKKNVRWCKENFGSENFLKGRIDADESTLHMHAFVCPITADGRLCAKEFTGGKVKLNHLQDTYAEAMRPFELCRGQNFMETPALPTRKHKKCISADEILKNDVDVNVTVTIQLSAADEILK